MTCITQVCSGYYELCCLASPMCVPDLMKYADLLHPGMFWILWSMLTCITHVRSRSYEVCWLASPLSSRSYEVCWLASPMYVLDLTKYADLHHPGVFWILWSMLTWITHVCSRSYEVCWLASPMCVLDLMKYADLHHPCAFKILWSMLTCITDDRST